MFTYTGTYTLDYGALFKKHAILVVNYFIKCFWGEYIDQFNLHLLEIESTQ